LSSEFENVIEDRVFTRRQPCCNDRPVNYSNPPTMENSLFWCGSFPPPEVNIQNDSCGWLWSHHVEWEGGFGDLAGSACDEEDRKFFTAPVEWITGTTSNWNPSLTWDFVWGSGYRLKRKIGNNGKWLTMITTSNVEDTTWIDTGIDVRTLDDPVYYKVYSKVYSSYASTGPQKVYYISD